MLYETTLLLSPQVSSAEIFSLWDKILDDVRAIGASIKKDVKPFERKLGYAIKRGQRFSRAYLGVFYAEVLTPQAGLAASLQELLKSHGQILRFMIKRVNTVPELTRKSTTLKSTSEPSASRENKVKNSPENQEGKEDKPPLADLDKKLEEILEDKIGF